MSGAAKRADHGGRTGALPGPPQSGERAVRRGGVRAVAVWYPVASFVVLALWSRGRPGGRCWPTGRAGSSGRRRPTYTCSGGLARWWPQCHYRAGSRLGRTGALSSQATAWRGRGRWLALATLGPLAMFLMAVVVARLVGGQWPALDRFGASTEYPALPIVTYGLANLVCYGFGEEVGWRGYRQPTLEQRWPVLGA